MSTKIKLDNKEYEVDDLNEKAKAKVALLQFTTTRVKELTNLQIILKSARQRCIDTLKKEVISKKAGFVLDDD